MLTRKIFSSHSSPVERMLWFWAMPALLMRTVGVDVSRTFAMVSWIEVGDVKSTLWYERRGTRQMG